MIKPELDKRTEKCERVRGHATDSYHPRYLAPYRRQCTTTVHGFENPQSPTEQFEWQPVAK
jgi:hypothetical protein